MYDNKRYFQIQDSKPSYAQWYAEIDISNWLGSETLNSVNFYVKNKNTGVDITETDTVLDVVKSTYSGSTLRPFIKNGTNLIDYRVTIKVGTVEGSKEEFYVDFDIKNG